jgi:DNA-binding MarR family transcriptional regulator
MQNLPFGFDEPEDSPGFLLWQTSTTWQRLIRDALASHNVSHSQFVIMALLLWLDANKIEPTQTIIANHTKLDKMTVSKSLKGLIERHLVFRTEDPNDSRAKIPILTDSGDRLIRDLVPIVEKIDEEFFGSLGKKDMESLIKALRKLNE